MACFVLLTNARALPVVICACGVIVFQLCRVVPALVQLSGTLRRVLRPHSLAWGSMCANVFNF